jgi:DNA-binding NarL/FixJ family response regulator
MMLVGLRKLLERKLEVVGVATDGQELLAIAERLRPDLVITDVEMPGLDGIEATRRLQASVSGVKVLILSIRTDPSCVRAAFGAGAWGYLTKTSAPDEIEHAVHEVLADRFYVSPDVARAALERKVRHREIPSQAPSEALTPRESDILRLVAEGLGNNQIAQQLGVAVTTVRTHLNSMYEKLRLKSRVELALFAAQAGGAAA